MIIEIGIFILNAAMFLLGFLCVLYLFLAVIFRTLNLNMIRTKIGILILTSNLTMVPHKQLKQIYKIFNIPYKTCVECNEPILEHNYQGLICDSCLIKDEDKIKKKRIILESTRQAITDVQKSFNILVTGTSTPAKSFIADCIPPALSTPQTQMPYRASSSVVYVKMKLTKKESDKFRQWWENIGENLFKAWLSDRKE